MTSTAVLLLLVGASAHAGWNLVSKRVHPSVRYFLLAVTVEVACLAPLAAWNWQVVAAIPPGVWLRMVASGLCLAVYFVTLSGAYRHGHMSVAYPLARSLPVVGVAAVTHLLGWGDRLTATSVVGMALVLAGCIVLPMRRFRELRMKNYLNLSCLLAVGAAVATVGFTLVDHSALGILRDPGGLALSASRAASAYICFEMALTLAFLWCFVLVCRPRGEGFAQVVRTKAKPAAISGAAMGATYVLTLTAMGHVANVSYVIAFLQTSILLGAVLGVVVLREPPYVPKFVGVGAMFAGLVLVALG